MDICIKHIALARIQSVVAGAVKIWYALLSLTLYGCFPVWHSEAYLVSQAVWQVESVGTSKQRLTGPDITFDISPSNIRWWTGGTPGEHDPFRITLWFDPKHSNFAFDPTSTVLILDEDTKMSPSQVHIEWAGGSAGWHGCGRYPKADFGEGPKYSLRRGSCFELYFHIVPPAPEKEFVLHIGGLSINGKRLDVPDIYFKKGKTWVVPIGT